MEEKPLVLVVDDERINRVILERVLDSTFKVFAAEGASEALEILESNPEINLVITDMRMPNIDGLEFVKTAQLRWPKKAYFMLSGYAITKEIQAAVDAGLIKAYFTKPAKFDQIKKALLDNL